MVRTARAEMSSVARAEERVADVGGIAPTLGELLAEVVGVDRVSDDAHFFAELGADSLVMARFCARVRKRSDLPPVSMKDIYQHPTLRSLSAALAERAVPPPVPEPRPSPEPTAEKDPIRGARYVLCGALQFLCFVVYAYLSGSLLSVGYEWVSLGSGKVNDYLHPLLHGRLAQDYALIDTGPGLLGIYLRALIFGAVAFVGICVFPILVKWLLIGRWTPRRIQLWSLGYVRFWFVKTLVRANPLVLFAGSPIYVWYLRALGARIGRGTVIFSRAVPVCADLLTVGPGTVIRKDSFVLCYRAEAGWIQTGTVRLGAGVFVGEKSVLDIDTAMGDGAGLGHTSALHSGQVVPAGEWWHGSPAVPAGVDYQRVPPARCGGFRRFRYAALQLLFLFTVSLPLVVGGWVAVISELPRLARMAGSTTLLALGTRALAAETGGSTGPALLSGPVYLWVAAASAALFLGVSLVGLLVVGTVPRLLARFVPPDRTYPLYGMRYRIHRIVGRMTNVPFFTTLFGDSSYIVHYLRLIGYDLSRVHQTGSNFGSEVRHESPYQCFVGTGTMIADGLSILSAEYSSTSFRVSQAAIGPRNFLGNDIAYPAGGRTGDNCLLATKVMVPMDGEVREGVGLLGSPCFEIPRSVERDSRFDHLRVGEEFRRRLAAKNRYNLRTMAFYLFIRWLNFLLIAELGMVTLDFYGIYAQLAVTAFVVLSVFLTAGYYVLVERCVAGFRRLRPRFCSIYDPYFWWHERFWKVPLVAFFKIYDGTPFKSLMWRLLGVRIGRWVFDDGCYITERTLVTLGDGCVLNAGSKIQCHSQEDGTFKSDGSVIGAGATVGVHCLVHYGVTMGEHSVLAADSFLMKGEEVPARARWGGNPARHMADQTACRV